MTRSDLAREIAGRLEPLAPVHLDLDDQSAAHAGHAGAAAGGGHFSLLVVSEAFSGAGRLDRHRRVMDRLADLIPHPVHALAIRALTPDEYFTSRERTHR
ncbi:MAG TPA: BolA family protein [Casimicrobiaceae bacterium]|nr:BolA family protein [Casimicrobiaceae bacterium]